MTEEVERPSGGGWRGPLLMMVVAVLVLLGVALAADRAIDAGIIGGGRDGEGDDAAKVAGGGARIRGAILLEVPMQPPTPTPIVDDGAATTGAAETTGAVEGIRVDTDTTTDATGVAMDAADAEPGGVPQMDASPEAEGPADTEGSAASEIDGVAADTEGLADTEGGDPPGAVPFELDDPWQPDPVELVAPQEGICRIVAWQKGVQVAGPVDCDANGKFELAFEPGVTGRTAFELIVPGRLRAVVEAEVPASGVGRLPTVALGLGQTIDGQVIDSRGEPVADVQLQAMPMPNLGEPEPWRVTTDDTGNFVIDTLPPGPVALRASKPGYAPSVVEAISPQSELLIVIDALMDLQGEVVGPADLVARASVRIEGSAIWPARTTRTEPTGAFSFEGIPDGVYALEAVVEDTQPDAAEYASVPLENVTPDLHVSLALTRAYRVPVRVVDPAGEPVAGARVTLGSGQLGLLQRVAQTDPLGQARVGPVVPGPYAVRADAEGFLPSDPIAVTVSAEPLEMQTLALSRPARIEGIVVDEHDRAVEGASVLVDSDALYTLGESSARAQTFERTLVATGTLGVTKGPVPEIPAFDDPEPDSVMAPMTDADGRFVVRDLAPGVYRLRAVHGRYAQSGQLEVQVRASEVRTGVRLVLRTGQPLTGRVLDGNSRPILGALVELDDGSAFETNDRGVFDAGFRRGRQTLLVRAPGKASERVEVRVDDDPIDVQIVLEDAEGALEGQALDGNLRPLDNVRVTVQMLDEVTPTLVAFTDERGAFEFQSLPTGPAELELDHPDFVPVTQRVQVQRAGRGQPIEVQLRSGWTLEVWVVEQGTQDPVRGAVVAAGGQHARTDAEGHAVLSRLSSDRVRVDVDAEDRSARPVMVNRPDGDRTQIEVTVVEGGGLEGTVSDYRGDGVAGAHVVVRDASDHGVLAQTVSGAGGRWSVDGVPEGDVVVEVFPPDSRADDLAEVAQPSDVLRGHVTRDVDVRFDRR